MKLGVSLVLSALLVGCVHIPSDIVSLKHDQNLEIASSEKIGVKINAYANWVSKEDGVEEAIYDGVKKALLENGYLVLPFNSETSQSNYLEVSILLDNYPDDESRNISDGTVGLNSFLTGFTAFIIPLVYSTKDMFINFSYNVNGEPAVKGKFKSGSKKIIGLLAVPFAPFYGEDDLYFDIAYQSTLNYLGG